jgi:hypothetical protein
VKDPKVNLAAIDIFEIFGGQIASLGQCFHHGDVIPVIW